MTLREYYNFPPDINVNLKYDTTVLDTVTEDYPLHGKLERVCDGSQRTYIHVYDTSNVTSFKETFSNSYLIKAPKWDSSNALDCTYMYNYSTIESVPEYDLSNCERTLGMFRGCSRLKDSNVGILYTPNVIDMNTMFEGCESFVKAPELNTSICEDMSGMFADCFNLTSLQAYDTHNCTTMGNMVHNCLKLEEIPRMDGSRLGEERGEWDNVYPLSEYQSEPYDRLTYIGGFTDMKRSWRELYRCPNLTMESCLDIIDCLYDFEMNGEVPEEYEGMLTVHPNFVDAVGGDFFLQQTLYGKGWGYEVRE